MVMRPTPAPDSVALEAAANIHQPRDPNTLSNYNAWRTKHTTANFTIDFEAKQLKGSVILKLEKLAKHNKIILDTSHLSISSVSISGKAVDFDLASQRTEPYGSPLTIKVPDTELSSEAKELEVEIGVATTKDCTALQWLTPAQTSNKKHPYIFSQCQAIHARSLFPCQDTPDVKSTYTFNLRSPLPVLASGLPTGAKDFDHATGTLLYSFQQDVPMPSYLFAVASGDLACASIGPRSTVWTGPEELKGCQWEFESETERYIRIAEKLVYDYAWGTYNVLVLPPSFPYGGMEVGQPSHQLAPTELTDPAIPEPRLHFRHTHSSLRRPPKHRRNSARTLALLVRESRLLRLVGALLAKRGLDNLPRTADPGRNPQ
jgi:leukotriene-A4 hydrolase